MAALDQFRRGEAELLIASDVAARGLDIPEVSHIFNFDVPHHPDDYVHRIGRTGRAGRSGTAITIVAPIDSKAVGAIERLISQTIPWMDKPAPSEIPAEIRSSQDAEQAPRNSSSRHRRGNQRPRPEKQKQPQRVRPPQPAEDDGGGHLPAFLLRPVPAKA
jgi:superfamily II DNA/RNA helicase